MGVIASVSSTFSFPLVSGGHVGMVFGWLIPSLFVMPIAAYGSSLPQIRLMRNNGFEQVDG